MAIENPNKRMNKEWTYIITNEITWYSIDIDVIIANKIKFKLFIMLSLPN
jgi:hypothetical protein